MEDLFNPDPSRKEITRETVVFMDIIDLLVGKSGTGGINEVLVRFTDTEESRFATPVKERVRGAIAMLELFNRRVSDIQTRMNKEQRGS